MSAETTTGKLIANLSSAYGSIGEECPKLRRAAGEVRYELRYRCSLSPLLGIRYARPLGDGAHVSDKQTRIVIVVVNLGQETEVNQ